MSRILTSHTSSVLIYTKRQIITAPNRTVVETEIVDLKEIGRYLSIQKIDITGCVATDAGVQNRINENPCIRLHKVIPKGSRQLVGKTDL